MVLFDDVVEVLDLLKLDLCVLIEIVAGDRRGVGRALIDGNPRRHTCWPIALRKKRTAAL